MSDKDKERKEKSKKRSADWRLKNKDRHQEVIRRWREEKIKTDPNGYRENLRKRRIKNRYGVSLEWYAETLKEQGGVCAICGLPPSSSDPGGILCIDHNHSTGRVRGLLCRFCNIAVGSVKESVSLTFSVAAYLDKHEGPTSWDRP